MLVKLAFAMQRLKKYLKKNFVMINKVGGGDNFWILWGDTAGMRGDIELMGGSPPLGKTLRGAAFLQVRGQKIAAHGVSRHEEGGCVDFIQNQTFVLAFYSREYTLDLGPF